MPIKYDKKVLTEKEVQQLLLFQENWLMDKKGKDIKPARVSRTISAFANTNGGEVFIGISCAEDKTTYFWDGLLDEEQFNPFITLLSEMFSGLNEFTVEYYRHPTQVTWVLHLIINKTHNIVYASDKKAYQRHGIQNLPCDTTEKLLRLQLDKGLASFEDETSQLLFDDIKNSQVLCDFLNETYPQTTPYDWLRKQRVMDSSSKLTVAGLLLYDECPQATLPKQSGVRIVRYHTDEKEGTRETLDEGYPISIEGDIYSLIHKTVNKVIDIVEETGVVGKEGNENKKYPRIALHEIITNAVLHRDYSLLKDIQIRIFTNRIEIESPGKLPSYITLDNILQEQCSRNPKIVRLISKFPSPPNKDAGEGLNTAFRAMAEMQLKQPQIAETQNSVVVTIKHERLADAETIVLNYLENHATISNAIARGLTGIPDANRMKKVFNQLKGKGLLEIVEGTRSTATLWQLTGKKSTHSQLSLFEKN